MKAGNGSARIQVKCLWIISWPHYGRQDDNDPMFRLTFEQPSMIQRFKTYRDTAESRAPPRSKIQLVQLIITSQSPILPSLRPMTKQLHWRCNPTDEQLSCLLLAADLDSGLAAGPPTGVPSHLGTHTAPTELFSVATASLFDGDCDCQWGMLDCHQYGPTPAKTVPTQALPGRWGPHRQAELCLATESLVALAGADAAGELEAPKQQDSTTLSVLSCRVLQAYLTFPSIPYIPSLPPTAIHTHICLVSHDCQPHRMQALIPRGRDHDARLSTPEQPSS